MRNHHTHCEPLLLPTERPIRVADGSFERRTTTTAVMPAWPPHDAYLRTNNETQYTIRWRASTQVRVLCNIREIRTRFLRVVCVVVYQSIEYE